MLRGNRRIGFLVILLGCLSSSLVWSADQPAALKPFKHQITGLFSPDREQDLRELFTKLPQFKLISIDYANAEATLEYDPAQVFPGTKPDQVVEQLNNQLRNASRGTFGAKPLKSIPVEKLKRIEIAVEGLDCKGCSLAAYQMIYQLPGVETATASFKVGKVTALVNPEKIDQGQLEKALKQGGVQIQTPTK